MMKSILAIVAMIPMAAFAAPQKAAAPAVGENVSLGTIEVKGDTSLGYSSTSQKTDPGGAKADSSGYGLGVTGLYYGYGQGPMNIGFGGTLSYRSDTDKGQSGAPDQKSSRFILGPAVGVDYQVQEKVSVFGIFGLGYARDTHTVVTEGSVDPVTFAVTAPTAKDVTYSGFGFNLGAGAKYFLTKSFSVDAGLKYEWAKLSGDSVGGVTPKVTTGEFGLNVGLSVYFPTK